jgi:translation initiation factor 4E
MSTATAAPVELERVKLGREYETTLPPMLIPKTGQPLHSLNTPWAFWTQKKVKRAPGASWHEGTLCLGRFDSVEGFWQLYSHLVRPDAIQGSADIMLFREGIKPIWEDDTNKTGGKWTLRMRKPGAAQVWEEVLLALVGETLEGGSDICGAILSVRYHDDKLDIWHKTGDNDALAGRLR